MRIFAAALASFFTLSVLASCTNITPEPVTPAPPAATATPDTPPANSAIPTQTPAAACAGKVDPPPAGLVAKDTPAPSFAIGAPGKGSLCEARVFTAEKPVTVYRVFSASYESSKRAGPVGAYWTWQKPAGSMANYRSTYEICVEWNDLDMLSECQLEVGAEVVLGPGQSATCQDGKEFAQSAANQVLVVKKADGKVPVTDCKQSPVTWTP